MALTVNSNIQAMNAYRNLSKTQGMLSGSLEKLSSGLRINRAADDAAGLAISEGLKAQIGGIQQASKNAQDGISLVQTADGALSQSQAILQRLRTLSVQSANGSQSADSRTAINAEATALKAELTRISDTSSFNSVNLLDGTYQAGRDFQIGYKTDGGSVTGNTIKVAINSEAAAASAIAFASATRATLSNGAVVAAGAGSFAFNTSALVFSVKLDGGAVSTLTVGADFSGGTSAQALTSLAVSLTQLASASFGSNKVVFAVSGTQLTVSAGTSDTTVGTSSTVEITNITLTGVAASYSFGVTVGAATGAATVAAVSAVVAGAFGAGGLGVATLDLSNQASATAAITAVDTAITNVSKARASLGALQNRFQYTVDNLDTTAENLSAAQSRITDTDMAQEMVAFTRSQILAQAGTSMLSQAKNLPSSILDLLRG